MGSSDNKVRTRMKNILSFPRKRESITLLVLLCCGIATVPLFCLDKPEEAGTGKLEDVVVKEKDTFKIEKQKPPIDININHMKVVLPTLETGKYFLEGREDILEIDDLNALPRLHSRAPISPWLYSIIDEPVITFVFGEEQIKTGTWELIITDMHGAPFRVFSGKNTLPPSLAWDGRDETGRFMKVGKVYSYIFKASKDPGRIHSSIGKPFSIDAAVHQEKRELYISLSLESLFKTTKDGTEISPKGRLLLREASDIIKDRFYSPISVKVYSGDDAGAGEDAKMISSLIAETLLIPEGRIKFEGHRDAPENYQANIIMYNRNEKRMNRYEYRARYGNKALKSMVIMIEPPAGAWRN